MITFTRRGAVALLAGAGLCLTSTVQARPYYMTHIQAFVDAHVIPWRDTSRMADLVKACNASQGMLSRPQLLELDNQWASEIALGRGPLLDSVLNSPLAKILRDFQSDNVGVVTELFVIGRPGFICASTEPTSDFWQADEPKWSEIFGANRSDCFIAPVDRDDSALVNQSQVSLVITDPQSGQRIGVLVVGVNIEAL